MPRSKSQHANSSCLACDLRAARPFCNLGPDSLKLLDQVGSAISFETGDPICQEGDAASGVFILCTGAAKLSSNSQDGRTFVLGTARPGDLIGLPAVVAESTYEVTARAAEPTRVKFIAARDFRRVLETHADFGVRVAQNLTHTCQIVLGDMKAMALSTSVPQRIANLLLNWQQESDIRPKVRVRSTQEEIAQMLGTSRETVSRTLSRFKAEGIIDVHGSLWTVRDQAALLRASLGRSS